MATENFMFNRKSARHTRIVEYETVYFTKAVKYDEKQQKRIRGLPVCLKRSFFVQRAKNKKPTDNRFFTPGVTWVNVRTYSRV
jgi:hypothetical protein